MTARSTPRRRVIMMSACAAATLTAAGLFWLTAAGNLAATGTRIARLEVRREALQERRSRALVAHALATDPRAVEARARNLGFGPPSAVEYIAAPSTSGAGAAGLGVRPHSPLGVLLAREHGATPAQPDAPGVVERLLTASLRPAAAHAQDIVATHAGATAR